MYCAAFCRVLCWVWCFAVCALAMPNLSRAWVLYQSKGESFRIEINGYLKNFSVVQIGGDRFLPHEAPKELGEFAALLKALYPQLPSQDLAQAWRQFREEMNTLGQNQTWLRLQLKMKFGEKASLVMAYELRPSVGSRPEQLIAKLPVVGSLLQGGLSQGGSGLAGFGAFTYFDDRFLDFPPSLLRLHSVQAQHQLDRLAFVYAFPFMDVTVGRQPISLGMGRVFRPNDVLAPFSPQELDTEQRRGVDAIKIEIPLGDVSELMLVGVLQRLHPSEERQIGGANYLKDPSPGGIARLKLNLAERVDLFVLTGYIHQDILGGVGISTSLFGAGIRAEAIYRYKVVGEDKRRPQGVFSASVGLDYNISAIKLIVGIEYFYNGVGATSATEYLEVAQDPRIQRGDVFNLGAHYLALYANWEIHPLLKFNLIGMMNLLDPSALIAPSLELSLKQDLSVLLSAYVGIGAQPTHAIATTPPQTSSLLLHSEFGNLGVAVILGIRMYF